MWPSPSFKFKVQNINRVSKKTNSCNIESTNQLPKLVKRLREGATGLELAFTNNENVRKADKTLWKIDIAHIENTKKAGPSRHTFVYCTQKDYFILV